MCGATNDDLVNVRPEVELWGPKLEMERWYVLRREAHNNSQPDMEILGLIFVED
jgi:hypothetical protein